jgi:hypothetical protein
MRCRWPGLPASGGRRRGRSVRTAASGRARGGVRAPARAARRAGSPARPARRRSSSGRCGVDDGDAAVGPVLEAQLARGTAAASGSRISTPDSAPRPPPAARGQQQRAERQRHAAREHVDGPWGAVGGVHERRCSVRRPRRGGRRIRARAARAAAAGRRLLVRRAAPGRWRRDQACASSAATALGLGRLRSIGCGRASCQGRACGHRCSQAMRSPVGQRQRRCRPCRRRRSRRSARRCA